MQTSFEDGPKEKELQGHSGMSILPLMSREMDFGAQAKTINVFVEDSCLCEVNSTGSHFKATKFFSRDKAESRLAYLEVAKRLTIWKYVPNTAEITSSP